MVKNINACHRLEEFLTTMAHPVGALGTSAAECVHIPLVTTL